MWLHWNHFNLKQNKMVKQCLLLSSSQQEMSPVLPVEGDERCGIHEAAGAWWHSVLLQGSLQHLCTGGMCGKLLTALLFNSFYALQWSCSFDATENTSPDSTCPKNLKAKQQRGKNGWKIIVIRTLLMLQMITALNNGLIFSADELCIFIGQGIKIILKRNNLLICHNIIMSFLKQTILFWFKFLQQWNHCVICTYY